MKSIYHEFTDLKKSAHHYIDLGHPVVPGGMEIINGQKRVWQSRWKKDGKNEAFTSKQDFDNYVDSHEGVNSLAIRCDNLTVIDIDVKRLKARTAFKQLYKIVGKKEELNVISTCAEQTQSGGIHLYYQLVPDLKKINLRKYNDRMDIDIQTGPGSVIYTAPTAGKYEWTNAGDVLEMPEKLSRYLKGLRKETKRVPYKAKPSRIYVSQSQKGRSKRAYMEKVMKNAEPLTEGSRNETMLKKCRAWFSALEERGMVEQLAAHVNRITNPPLDQQELEVIINQAESYYRSDK